MKKPGVVSVLIFVTVAVVVWVAYEVYSAFRKEPVLDIPEKTLEVVDPTLDTSLLEGLSQRVFFEEGAVPEPVATQEPQPQPETEEIEEATDSGTLAEEPLENETQPEGQ